MSLKRIDGPQKPKTACGDPNHEAQTSRLYHTGRYIHKCPGCKTESYFIVARVEAV